MDPTYHFFEPADPADGDRLILAASAALKQVIVSRQVLIGEVVLDLQRSV
jgi:hypothetical protein